MVYTQILWFGVLQSLLKMLLDVARMSATEKEDGEWADQGKVEHGKRSIRRINLQ
jgi:hypothetical protein